MAEGDNGNYRILNILNVDIAHLVEKLSGLGSNDLA